MEPLSTRQSILLGLALAALMAITRNHHVGDLTHLPDASWAIFFMAGFYLGTRRIFGTLLAVAAITDLVAITWGGVSNFCVSPAYAFLLPAYGALFLAGRWFAARYAFAWKSIVSFIGAAFTGALICELISSGSFYLFSGRFTNLSLAGFGERFAIYFPGSLESAALWLGAALLIHMALTLATARALRTR